MIITIDGPAGAGKSSAARALAARLGFEFLNTGAMYRSVALAALRAGIVVDDEQALGRLLGGLQLEMQPDRVVLNGVDVSAAIRTPEVEAATAAVSDKPIVRRFLVEKQRQIAAGRDIVCEGRDQGTVVFPDAGCKFFLVADVQERALRRQREMAQRAEKVELGDLVQAIATRDRRDAARDAGPMLPADDALVVDSTRLSLDEVVGLLEGEVRRRLAP